SWAACSSNRLAAADLAGGGFKLDYFTTTGDLPNGAVEMMYFSKGDCSCGFAPKTKGIPNKLLYGLRKASAIRTFMKSYELFPGLCPPPTNTWSKFVFCVQKGVPGCGG
ncbi:MAG: hypothetical protein AB7S59_23765, partial [Parvibaculaceae bacterium]